MKSFRNVLNIAIATLLLAYIAVNLVQLTVFLAGKAF